VARDRGFSIVETLLALALTMVVAAGAFALLDSAQAAFSAVPEIADVQQRLRVAADTVAAALLMAGAGPASGPHAGSLHMLFAPVLPYRVGYRRNAPPGSFATDTITVLFVPPAAAEATASVPVTAGNAALRVNTGAACLRDRDGTPKPTCGFRPGTTVLIADEAGRHDVFTVTAVDGDVAQLAVHKPPGEADTVYPAGSLVVEIVARTYTLRTDAASGIDQLVSYDGSDRADVPVVDDVVGVEFEYFGDPDPPILIAAPEDPIGPWTSYGPRAPPVDAKVAGYPEGENCTFARDDSGRVVPRLAALGGGSSLVKLTAGQLADGPWCPDADSVDRYDADLLRIRAIAVTIRLQSALEVLRGAASPLFLHAGSARDSRRWVPDREARFLVTPRNLNPAR
jgi:hypothetical protein